MLIGVPTEIKQDEYRGAMLKVGVEELARRGHQVLVQAGGVLGSGLPDLDYLKAGCEMVATSDEIFSRADMIVKVKEALPAEWPQSHSGQVVFTYLHFAADRSLTEAILATGCTAVAYETLADDRGRLPLLTPMIEVAGRMSIQEGTKYLDRPQMGRGILLGGVPGVAPANILILGGGVVGANAANIAAGFNANVAILDINMDRLRYLADAYARVHGMGALCVTYCVGGLSVCNSIAGAYAEKEPVVMITGSPGFRERIHDPLVHHMVRNFRTQYDVFEKLCVAGAEINDPLTAFCEIDRVLAGCRRYRRPVYLDIPRARVHVVPDILPPPPAPEPESDPHALAEAVDEAVRKIRSARQPVLLLGVEVHRFGLHDLALKLAETPGIPLAATMLGNGVVAETHPLYMGLYERALAVPQRGRPRCASSDFRVLRCNSASRSIFARTAFPPPSTVWRRRPQAKILWPVAVPSPTECAAGSAGNGIRLDLSAACRYLRRLDFPAPVRCVCLSFPALSEVGVIRRLLVLCMLVTWCAPASAQRVQFPSTAAPVYTPPQATPQPSLPAFDPYASSTLGPPPVDVPYSAAPATNPYALQPNIGSQPSAGLFTGGPPVRWESGTYDYQNPDGSVARLQRFLQQISFEHTWLYGDHGPSDLEINRTELSATFGIPIFYNPDTPLLLTPGFAFNWLEGPVAPGTDLPPRLYDAYLDAAWHPRFSDWFHADLGFRTGVWTDFEQVNSDSVRLLGRGLAVLAFSPRFDVLAGVWYIDRNDIKLLPAGGFHWRPNAEWDAYVVFPNPKVRKRLMNIGTSQWWMYFAGEYGGGRWTLERASGAADDIDINDIRVIFGFEWETQTQARGHVEVGYVWDREIIFAGTGMPARLKLDDTVMVRAGVDF